MKHDVLIRRVIDSYSNETGMGITRPITKQDIAEIAARVVKHELLNLPVVITAGALVDVKDDPLALQQAIDLLSVAVKEMDDKKLTESAQATS